MMLRRLQLTLVAAALWSVCWAYMPHIGVLVAAPLIAALRGASVRQALYVGLGFGILQSFVLAGILYAGLPLFAALALTYGLAGASFALSFAWLGRRAEGLLAAALAASLWVTVEWLHAQVPYSASDLLGDSQWTGPFLPLARVGGSYLVSFVLVFLAAGIVIALDAAHRPRRRMLPLAVAVGFFIGLRLWAEVAAPTPAGSRTVAVAQGGLPTWLYARAETDPAWRDLPEQVYLRLTDQAAPADLLVWPETAVWRVWGNDREYEALLRRVRDKRGGALLVGLPRQDGAASFANAGVLLTKDQEPRFVDKRRLALLAEAGFAPGHAPGVLDVEPDWRLGVIFCLETVAPQYIADVVAAGANMVVVLAEGSRFAGTPVGWIHADHSVIRAVEVGRTVIHAGQHGYSTIIDAAGRRTDPLPRYVARVVAGAAELHDGVTPYMRFGPWILWLAPAVVLFSLLHRVRRRPR